MWTAPKGPKVKFELNGKSKKKIPDEKFHGQNDHNTKFNLFVEKKRLPNPKLNFQRKNELKLFFMRQFYFFL